MTDDADPAALVFCRLRLGAELRRLRRAAGLKSAQVVRRLFWSASKLTRLETGENATVDPADVRTLCGVYRADDGTRALLEDLATVTRSGADRWTVYAGSPDAAPGLVARLGLERVAAVAQDYEAELVPRALRTVSYARAIAARRVAGHCSPEGNDGGAFGAESPGARYTAVLNESVLRRSVGGPAVMREQLAHIADTVENRPLATVQVLPFQAGVHPAMSGSFSVLRFSEDLALPPVAWGAYLLGGWARRGGRAVEPYADAFSGLQAAAAGPGESLDMIRGALGAC